MNSTEASWEKLLNIRTTGRDDTGADTYRYPYEPTPYTVLERLANSGLIGRKNCLIDYGCGKGRVGFYLAYQVGCHSVGIEYDERIYQAAVRNKQQATQSSKVEFCLTNAEEYEVDSEADRFYFFNPFAVELLHKVIHRIANSYYDNPRQMLLFFYYPSDEYVAMLMSVDELTFYDEIDCSDLFAEEVNRERILVFAFGE